MTAGIAVAALLLSGCASSGDQQNDTASAQQQRDFPAVYDQEIDWQECGEGYGFRDGLEEYLLELGANVSGLRCAWITAPLDWDAPDNEETIQLSALHIPAAGDDPIGTLFSNPGGPGASGTEFAMGLTASEGFAEVHKKYDLLGFDPRGIGRSSPIQCDADTEIFELKIALCADENPLALSMGSVQVARDMELLRTLVGDEKMHYAGFSYGTVIGASYATAFPEKVSRIMLDSAWPSDWSSPLGSYYQTEAIARAKLDMLAGCGTVYDVQVCPIGSEAALIETLDRLETQPLSASDGTEVGAEMFNGYLTTALYQAPAGRQLVLETAGRALAGEQAAIDELAKAMDSGGASVGPEGMVVRCLSAPRDSNLVGLYEYITEKGLLAVLGGPEITDDSLSEFVSLECAALPDSGEDYLDFSYSGSEPILVYGITGDHATPYEGAQQMVDELGNAVLVTLEGSGHIATFTGRSTCADDIASAYLLRGEVPAEGTVCADD